MTEFPKDGKIVLAPPELATRLFDIAQPHLRNRIFTLDSKDTYIIDVDEVFKIGDCKLNEGSK